MLRLSLGELESWGEALGRGLRAPRVVTLGGDLGAGKTTLVQAICRGYGVTEPQDQSRQEGEVPLGHWVAW